MRFNIVSPWALQHDHILRRMAHALVTRLGWKLSELPDGELPSYFFPYQFAAHTGNRIQVPHQLTTT
jgi:hypothetical protein